MKGKDLPDLKPENTSKAKLIDGIKLYRQQSPQSEYDRLIRQQARLIHPRDPEARQKLIEQDGQKEFGLPNLPEIDLKKKWTKLSKNSRIEAMIQFVQHKAETEDLTQHQINQLRYLLVSSVSQKKLGKVQEIEYDSEEGKIVQIIPLAQNEQGEFYLT